MKNLYFICMFVLILFENNLVVANELLLDVEDASLYVQPGENVITDMDVRNLQQKVCGCQAMLGYSSTYLQASAGCVVPGDEPWHELIYNSWDIPGMGVPGEIDTAIGIDVNSLIGTDKDLTVAIITLKALNEEGATQMVFRPDVDDIESTFLADMNAEPVWPTKYDSQIIIIDGTDPTVVDIKATQFGGPDLTPSGSGNAVPGIVDITVATSDNLSGAAGPPTVTVTSDGGSPEPTTFVDELPAGTFNYTWEVSLTPLNGIATITVSGLTDNAGNVAVDVTDTFDIYYVSGTIGDFVWNDTNRDGIQDAYEPGISDVNILLKNNLGAIIDTTTTDGDGFYEFAGLCAGTYTVVVDENTLPSYFVPSLCNQGGDDSKDNDCSPIDVTLPDDFTNNPTIDFGYNVPCCELDVTKVGCVLVPRDDCDGKVIRMTLKYTGQGCDASSHNQTPDEVSCTGDPNSAEPVDIVVTNTKGNRVWAYAAGVSVGDLIFADAARAGRFTLEFVTVVKIFDPNGNLLQDIKFNTSCLQPLNVGDQFGSMFLISLTTTEGGEVNLPDPNDTCITELPPTEGSSCDGAKIRTLRLRYTGGGCAQTSHSQATDMLSCWDNGQDSPSPVRIYAIGKWGEIWLDTGDPNVEFGDIAELAAASAGESELSSETTVFIFDANDELVEEVAFHTSCSEPLNLGDQFGSLQVFGMEATTGDTIALEYDVEYTYTITNTGSIPITNVIVVDDVFGEVPGSPIPLILPGDGNSVILILTTLVGEATTNCVVVTGNVLESDFYVDGIVNFKDFAHFSALWLDNSCVSAGWCDRADLNMNGTVDIFDLAIFSDQWLLEYTPCEATACVTITETPGP